jgi:hypothetical protein
MATPLDTSLIDAYTRGINVPLASQAGHVVRVNPEGTNYEFIGPQMLAGSGTWDGSAELVLVGGSGVRTVTLGNGFFVGQRVRIVDRDGTANAGTITIAASPGTLNGSPNTIAINYSSREYLYAAADTWIRLG